jgi:DNA-binding Lrp family transcriptional regulator
MADLDEFDRKILRLLQDGRRLKTEAIGEEVGLSATAVQRRIKRLRDAKVIQSEMAIIDAEAVGGRIRTVVGVVLERGQSDVMDAFKRRARQEAEVQQCYWVTGEYDFILVVAVRSTSDYEALARRLFVDDPSIRRFDTFVAMETVKLGLQIPL